MASRREFLASLAVLATPRPQFTADHQIDERDWRWVPDDIRSFIQFNMDRICWIDVPGARWSIRSSRGQSLVRVVTLMADGLAVDWSFDLSEEWANRPLVCFATPGVTPDEREADCGKRTMSNRMNDMLEAYRDHWLL